MLDVLSDVLREVRFANMVHGRLELTAPWGARIEAAPEHACFYVVAGGSAVLEVGDMDQPIVLASGDFVLLPHETRHVLRDNRRTRAVPLPEILASGAHDDTGVLRWGGGGAHTSMVCGCFTFEQSGPNPLLQFLPPVIHVRGDSDEQAHWFAATVRFIAAESSHRRPGVHTMMSRLADLLFIHAVRTHLEREGQPTGWLRALTDRQIGTALGFLHAQPEHPWTVQSLAARVGMSRSAFAARFAELIGEPPLAYLTRWRMQKAARLLHDQERNIGEIATLVGYESQQAFSKAFKRWAGVAPTAYAPDHGARANANP